MEEPDYADVWALLGSFTTQLRKELDSKLKHAGLRLIEMKVLSLSTNGQLTMNQIAEELSITRAGITFLSDVMEKRGLIRKERRSGDRRVIILRPTRKGTMLLKKARVLQDEMLRKKLNCLEPRELVELRRLILKLIEISAISEK
ncbi:MAG: MarR family transcriptional regulator [Methanomassiliicoccales archaeon]